MPYDQWKTSEPDDQEVCETHGTVKPCRICRQEALEDRAERDREDP